MESVSKIDSHVDNLRNLIHNNFSNEQINNMLIKDVIDLNHPIIKNGSAELNVRNLKTIEKSLEEIKVILERVKEEIEIRDFMKLGNIFDFDKLRIEFEKNNLQEVFPKFNFDRYVELLRNPIKEIKNYKSQSIVFDSFWIKKNMIAINQMIFNEMDLYILNIGKEGSGKSCWSSQQILYFWVFLTEVGLIDYAYEINKMFFIDISTFLENHELQGNKDFFRIECLDEGNQLHRGNFREETNQQFKYEMRTERKMLRIIMINMQQIGELDTSISLSRVNFIYNCKMRSNKKLGMLQKGFIDMYIIPRGNEIYSEKNKKILSRSEILNSFAIKLDKKKEYYISLPKHCVIHNFRFDNVWGFNKDEYDDFVKDKMKERRFQKKLKITDEQCYALVTKVSNWKDLKSCDLKVAGDKKIYHTLNKMFAKFEKYFESNPEKYNAMKYHYRND